MAKRTLFALIVVGCLFVSLDSFAQFYVTGDDPASVKWRIIKGPHYSVIYPNEIDSLAKRYYVLLSKNREAVFSGLEVNPRSIPVVLHPYTVRSNGLVVWAPKRMELYTQPSANNTYSQNWEEQLVLHESRHVGQMEHFTKGIFNPLGWLIGQQAQGLGVALYPPIWLMEGDAVAAETELSQSGRGRNASFLSYYRLSFLTREYRSWNQWRFGSLKYYTPDHYALGYMLIGTARYKIRNYALTGNLMRTMVRGFYNPCIRDFSFRKVTGFTPRRLMTEADSLMTKLWRENATSANRVEETDKVTDVKSNYFTEYGSITAAASSDNSCRDTIYAVKNSYNKAAMLVRILYDGNQQSKEKIIRSFSSTPIGRLQYCNGKLFWCETINDSRWGHRSFNDLFSYDVALGKIKRLSYKKSYNNPALSISGDTIAVSEYHIKGGSSVSLLKASDGSLLKSFKAPHSGQIVECAINRGILYATVITENGIGLFFKTISVEEKLTRGAVNEITGTDKELTGTEEWGTIIEPQRANIRDFVCDNTSNDTQKLYFTSDANGVDNIYCYDLSSAAINLVTKNGFGVKSPFATAKRLYYIELGLNSNNIVTISKSKIEIKNQSNIFVSSVNKVVTNAKYPIAELLSEQIKTRPHTECDSVEIPASQPYNKLSNLLRIHSWAPIYYNIDKLKQMSYDNFYEVAGIGATIYSQNTLGTAVTMLGYSYRNTKSSTTNGFHAGHFKFTYSGFYPVIEFSADINSEQRYKSAILHDSNAKITKQYHKEISSPYFEAELRSYLPLMLNSHGWQRGFIPQISYKLENNLYYNGNNYIPYDQMKFILQGYVMRPLAKAAAYPRYGAGFIARYSISPSGYNFFSPSASVKTYFYLPGLFSTHGIKISAEYQRQFTEGRTYYVKNMIEMPSGYDSDITAEHLSNIGISYALPLYLNDLDLGFFAYLQRVRLIPFANYVSYKKRNSEPTGNKKGTLYSFGADFIVDGYFFRIGAPVSIGFRYSRLKYDPLYQNSKNHLSLLFNIALTR